VAKNGQPPVTYNRPDVFQLVSEMKHGVDDANRVRQGLNQVTVFSLLDFEPGMGGVEKAWKTWYWENRVFAFLLGIAESNTYSALKHSGKHVFNSHDIISPRDFRIELGMQMIQLFDQTKKSDKIFIADVTSVCTLIDTRLSMSESKLTRKRQLRCRSCTKKSDTNGLPLKKDVTTCCSCSPEIGRCKTCWSEHYKEITGGKNPISVEL